MDDQLKTYVDTLTDGIDTILMGRKMTGSFVSYWEGIVKDHPEDPQHPFAKKMCDILKVVFTKTLAESVWNNTRLAKGDLAEEVSKLKKQQGKDIVVYGGADFASSLMAANLIDEYQLFINPVAIGKGKTIFGKLEQRLGLKLAKSMTFDCGIIVAVYHSV